MIPGNDGYFKVTVANEGTLDLSSVYLKLESLDVPLEVISDDFGMRYLGGLKSGGSITTIFKFKVPQDTPSGTYAARYTVHRYSADSIEKMVVDNVLIKVQAPSSLSITDVSPASFRPGEKTSMTLTLKNTGGSSINDIALSWQMSGDYILPFGSDNRIAISTLEPGQEMKIPVNIAISAGASPDLYPLTIEATYYDQTSTQQSVNSTVGITIEGTTDFAVIVQEVSGSAVSFSIANVGVNQASAITVKIPMQESFSVTGTSEAFLGNLDPGDYSVESFQITPRKKGSLIMEISYTDDTGYRATLKKEVTIPEGGKARAFGEQSGGRAGPGSGANSSGENYILIGSFGIAAIVLFFIFWKVKKGREK
ncbi:MAG: NEW3 domain-containing protein [Candidatus Hydrothermarchaeaceae archaeon]